MRSNARPFLAMGPALDLIRPQMHLGHLIHETGYPVIRLLLALCIAFAAISLTFGLAGPAQAHGGSHEMQGVVSDVGPSDPVGGHKQPCHCQGNAFCVQMFEAGQPLQLLIDQQLRAVGMVFEPRFERSEFVPTDPPPPRA